jgi:hypothetical protein
VTDETRARFLTAIAAQLPLARIVEVHLFPAIRQGGMESGVAVVAVEPPDVDTPAEPVSDAPSRYIVFSARYRHTLKGPDRGKWETSVTEEADAPLRTVDLVVRGVQRRSGEVDEIVRLSGDELRAVIPATATP